MQNAIPADTVNAHKRVKIVENPPSVIILLGNRGFFIEGSCE